MKEVVNKRKSDANKMAIKLLWYYLVILLVPTISITIIYFTAREALIDVQKEKSYRIMTNMVSDFDREIEGLRNIATYLSEDAKIMELLSKDDKKENMYYDMYKIVDEFSVYTLTNSMVEDICIWFLNKDYIISIPKVIPKTERGISTISSLQGESCEALEDNFCGKYHYINMECVETTVDSKDQMHYRIIQSLPDVDNGVYNGAIIISLNNKVINSFLKKMKNDNSSVFLLDQDGKIIQSFLNNEYPMDNHAVIGMDYSKVIKNQKNVVTYKAESKYYSWSFVVVTPKSELIKEIGIGKYLMVFLYVMSILVGVLICIYYWHNNKNTVKQYYRCSENLAVKVNVSGSAKAQNENRTFWRSLGTFLEQVENLKDTLDKQQEIVHKECIRKLLFGNYESIQEFKEEAGDEAERFLQYPAYYVVVVRIESQLSGDFLISNQKFQEKVQNFFASELMIQHWIYPIENYTYAMILADDQNRNLFGIKEEIGKIDFYNQGVSGSFLGISHPVETILKVSGAYEEAVQVCKNASFFQIHVPLIQEETEVEIRGAVMSLEDEFQLEQILLHGSENDLEAMLLRIRELNIEQVQHHYWVTHMIKMLQCILVRCLKKESDDFSNQLIAKVQKTEWPDEIYALLRIAKRHQMKVAEEKKDKQREEVKLELERIIHDNYSDMNFSLLMVAERMNTSEQRLYKEFKLYFGVTFSDYLENLRIQKAGQLLMEGIAVKDVAVQVGYGSDYSFRRAFKRITSMTPSTFINIK
jgi:two-component system, response regulator YesN